MSKSKVCIRKDINVGLYPRPPPDQNNQTTQFPIYFWLNLLHFIDEKNWADSPHLKKTGKLTNNVQYTTTFILVIRRETPNNQKQIKSSWV